MNFHPGRLRKKHIILIIIFIIEGAVAYGLWNLYYESQPQEYNASTEKIPAKYVFKPGVSIGCNRVVWKDAVVHLAATTNLRPARFQWLFKNKTIGTERELVYTFIAGEHNILLKATSGNDSVQDEISIIAVDSTEGISAYAVAGSMSNERVFITKFKDAMYYVDGVSIILDNKDMGTIPECRKLIVSGLYAGSHTWKATYRGNDIGSGSFKLEPETRIKITRVNIAGNYRAGDTVEGRISLLNRGTVPVKAFSIRTLVVNHKFEWMGDVAKKDFTNSFDYELVPGAPVEIPVSVQIPEKISGIRPAGDYTITIQLIVNNNVMETQSVNTVVV